MKFFRYALIAGFAATMLTACSDDDWSKGAPSMKIDGDLGNACFGDSLTIKFNASDAEVPLSTFKAKLYFDQELVSESTVRTKVSGSDYVAKVFVPYLANIPDGRAILELTLQNINFTTETKVYEVNLTHPDYEYLTFEAADGTSYRMDRKDQYVYEFTDRLPQELNGRIIAPAYGENGNEFIFGYRNSSIVIDGEDPIPFSSNAPGTYTVSFNTYSFEGSPFNIITCNGNKMTGTSRTTSQVDLPLNQGDKVVFSGVTDYDSYWIDPDYFAKNDDGSLTFLPISGDYRIIADSGLKYFRVYPVSNGEPAKFNESNGTGDIWIIGEGIGLPSLADNTVGWTTEKALGMAPIGNGKYQITLVGGQTVGTSSINFKFFGQMGWGFEFGPNNLTTTSNLIGIGDKETNGKDNGNLFLLDGVTLENNAVYVFTVDVSAGTDKAVLTVVQEGKVEVDADEVSFNGSPMETADGTIYSIVANLKKGDALNVTGLTPGTELYADPDYVTADGKLAVIDGNYKVTVNTKYNSMMFSAVSETGSDLTLQDDGSGALWLMGNGLGSIVCTQQLGFTPGAAHCMAQVSPGVYQFTGRCASLENATIGDRFSTEKTMQLKFFHQNGWGGEFANQEGDGKYPLTATPGCLELMKLQADGNLFPADGVTLEEGATYRVTVDVTGGKSAATVDFCKL